jgi:GPN-loop GTPase
MCITRYKLGPNGAIMTSLNLFSTQFHQVINLIEAKAHELEYVQHHNTTQRILFWLDRMLNTTATGDGSYVIVDTPGQIEVFNWSASGSIILGSLASALPTVMCYIVDTPRCANPSTFMSNMLYACSILYKSRLPLILVFNKTDSLRHEFAIQWYV